MRALLRSPCAKHRAYLVAAETRRCGCEKPRRAFMRHLDRLEYEGELLRDADFDHALAHGERFFGRTARKAPELART